MKIRTIFILLTVFCMFAGGNTFGQEPAPEDRVDVFLSVSPLAGSLCERSELGRPLQTFAPDYPPDAKVTRTGGAVRVELLVGNDGRALKVMHASGPKKLIEPARKAALATRFSESKCDGLPVQAQGILIFNFVPVALTDLYTKPEKAEGFADVTSDSTYFEPVLTLTENYGLTFGYADGRFHPESPLTKGDFAHFLRLTLDLLQQRAEVSRKFPREIELYFPMNKQRLKSPAGLTDLDTNKPYATSVGLLITKYDIALTTDANEFKGDLPLTLREVLNYWKRIFGKEALPVHFKPPKAGERIMSRGEFALFLHESLYVLTYKVLP